MAQATPHIKRIVLGVVDGNVDVVDRRARNIEQGPDLVGSFAPTPADAKDSFDRVLSEIRGREEASSRAAAPPSL
jgi:hypothetical protein